MSMDYEGRDPVNSPSDSPLFGTPVWERGNRRRGAAARRPAETRTFAADDAATTLDRPLERPAATSTIVDEAPMAAPIGPRTRTTTRARASNGAAPAALVAGGVAVVAVLAGIGWYGTHRDSSAVPEMTPGASSTSQVAAAPLTPPEPAAATPAPTQMATATPAPSPTRVAPERAPARLASNAHVRHAPAASGADTSGMNVSAHATMPDGPQPYSAVTPQATPAPVNPVAPPAPAVQQATPPATTAQPEAIPSTPPVTTPAAPAPQQVQPTAPDTQTTPPTR